MRLFNLYLLPALFLLPLTSKAQVEACATENKSDRLIVMINDEGNQDVWSIEEAKDLSFCISPVFRSNYEIVEKAARSAAAEWMKHGNFDFKLTDNLSCDNNSRDVLFQIKPTARQAKFKARAFFPSSERRAIQINRRFAGGNDTEMHRLLLHELGHVLGVRHEHIHPDTGGDCPEDTDFETITDYDPQSVMHYPVCGPKKLKNFVLSDLDKEGIGLLYPPQAD